jgi:hypothetical protein
MACKGKHSSTFVISFCDGDKKKSFVALIPEWQIWDVWNFKFKKCDNEVDSQSSDVTSELSIIIKKARA